MDLVMEEVEANLVEGGIGWLAQTVLENLSTCEMEAWIRQVGLADDTAKLRSEIERVETVVAAAVTGRRSKPLARLRELLYDADDAVDELDYCRIQQQLQGAAWEESADGPSSNAAGIASSSGVKKRSKAWEHFDITEKNDKEKPVKARCIHCQTEVQCESDKGTSVLHNHLKSGNCRKRRGATDQAPDPSSASAGGPNGNDIATGNSVNRKRMRISEASTQDGVADTHPWNKAEFSSRIQQMTRQLQKAMSEVLMRLHGPDSVASSNLNRCTTSDWRLRTSSLVQRKMYGRYAEKKSIIKLMTEVKSECVTVLPIVGIGGTGKTALAQLVYNDPVVESHFPHRIWVWVSNNFDEVRLTREMLDFVCQEKHEGLCSFAKLQEILMSNIKSERFLLILDDIWDDMNTCRWSKLLAPLNSNTAEGNVVLVTTRKLSVAKRIGTVELIELDALDKKDLQLLFKACAFGDENYEAHQSLSIIGQQIEDKLKGNPLAAETAGELLREQHTIDHWNNILKNEDWKSLQLSGGIMSSLKLSYDPLPYHLKQCFLYSSLFPSNYQFVGEELVHIWISQGFVKCSRSNKRLEEIGREYLIDLVNSGFFKQIEIEKSQCTDSMQGDQACYATCGLMHDFARIVSRTEHMIMDDLQCNKVAPTIRHLSILTDSANHKDPPNENFEEIIRNAVTSVRNLRTLVLIGNSGPLYLQAFKDIVKKARNLRLLHVSLKYKGYDPLALCNLVNPTHLRYMKLDKRDLHQSLSKLYHLQVLDANSNNLTINNGVDDLVSLRHFVAAEGELSSIPSIGKMTSLQELHDFSVSNSRGKEIAQLQSLNELVQLGVSKLENVATREEASESRLRDKQHLEMLRLSWTPSLLDEPDKAREVLEGLEPHQNLKHLQIFRYNGTTCPSWLATSLTSLQTLCLEWCQQWKIIPSLEGLPFLRKLDLRYMLSIVQVSIPSLEELILIGLPSLERCHCTSTRNLMSSLRVLKIKMCRKLPLSHVLPELTHEDTAATNCNALPSLERLHIVGSEITGKWLSKTLRHVKILQKLSLRNCKQITGLAIGEEVDIQINPMPSPEASTSGYSGDPSTSSDQNGLLRFPLNLVSSLKMISIGDCPDLTFHGGMESFSGLTSLKALHIRGCPKLLSSLVPQANGRWLLPQCPPLERLRIDDPSVLTTSFCSCLPSLQRLELDGNNEVERLTDEQDSALQLLKSLQELRFECFWDLEDLPAGLHSFSSLKKLEILDCICISKLPEKGLPPSLEELHISNCSEELTDQCKTLTNKLKVKGLFGNVVIFRVLGDTMVYKKNSSI